MRYEKTILPKYLNKGMFLCMALYFPLCSSAQKLTVWNDVTIKRFGKETIFSTPENKPLNGHYKIASDKGNYSEIRFIDGKINGTRDNYNAKGIQTESFQYKKGMPHGKWIYYDENEKPKAVETYKAGNKHGKWWKKKFKQQNYFIATAYYEDDIPVGTWTEKWPNKTLKSERIYEGLGTYTQKEYHNNGKLHTQKSFNQFKLHGAQLVYSTSGTLLERKTYRNDVLEKLEYFFKNGQLDTEYNYKNGVLHGTCIDYYPSGGKHWIERYENGYRSGVWIQYIDDGWLYSKTTYKDDIPNGTCTIYYSSGIIEEKGEYVNGSRNGIWKFYHQSGKLHFEVEYKKGIEFKRVVYNR